MKKTALITMILSIAIGVLGQKKELPTEIRDSLLNRYPNASDIKFKKQKSDFRIKLDNGGIRTSTFYDYNGNWKNSESLLKLEQIPEKVKQSLIKKYPAGSFNSAKLFESNDGTYYYNIIVETEKFLFDLELDKTGKIIKTEKLEIANPEDIDKNQRDVKRDDLEGEGGFGD